LAGLLDITEGKRSLCMDSLFTLSTFSYHFLMEYRIADNIPYYPGYFSAMIFGTSPAILTSVFGPGERGRAMA
jgi:hypothetical protein